MVSSQHTSANKRIAVNTLMLYGRMIFLTLINIYTVRVTLECLGDMDYGVYEAIASFIGAMGFLTGTMTSASQRFLSFHLGKADYGAYSRTYSMLMGCFVAVALIVVIVGESLSSIFVSDVLNIPGSRLGAALWVYRFTILAFALNLISIPFTAQIVANEKMGVFAYFSIADGMMKLVIVLLLLNMPTDRLVLYAGLLAGVAIVMDCLYLVYCKMKFRFSKFRLNWDKALLKELGGYTGWNLFGSLSGMLVVQGQAVLLNIYFGPLVNAAKGVANRIYNVIGSFSTNMFMAFSPQIVKSYAQGEHERMTWLAMQSSRLSYFLLTVLSFPLIVVMESLLDLWLGASLVTPLMVAFSRLALIFGLVQALEPPITQMIRATGEIKEYQIRVGVWTLMYIPICILVLWIWRDAVMTMWVLIVLYSGVMAIRVRVAHRQVALSYGAYLRQVVLPLGRVSVILVGVYLLTTMLRQPSGWGMWIVWLLVCGVVALTVTWLCGFSPDDRNKLLQMIRGKLVKKITKS